jgi:hypothetical protein
MKFLKAHRTTGLFVLAAAFLFLTCFGASAQEVRHGNGNGLRPNGKHQGIEDPNAPPEQETSAEPEAKNANQDAHAKGQFFRSSGNGIYYHGGPVLLGTVNVYYIWYGNWSGNSATSLLSTLVSDLNNSSYEHINTTYYNGTNQHVSGQLHLAGQVNDNYSEGTSLGDANIESIVANHCSSLGGCDTNGVYFVLTSADVNETSGFCTQYCGWHTDSTISGKNIKYAFVGNPDRCPSACEAQTTSPNGNSGADGMASIIAHESEEAISDPDLNAWYDRRGEENADKCAWTFGTVHAAANGSAYNFVGGSGTEWLIQQNWVNASGGYCSMSY